jgi:hypothetical protein
VSTIHKRPCNAIATGLRTKPQPMFTGTINTRPEEGDTLRCEVLWYSWRHRKLTPYGVSPGGVPALPGRFSVGVQYARFGVITPLSRAYLKYAYLLVAPDSQRCLPGAQGGHLPASVRLPARWSDLCRRAVEEQRARRRRSTIGAVSSRTRRKCHDGHKRTPGDTRPDNRTF